MVAFRPIGTGNDGSQGEKAYKAARGLDPGKSDLANMDEELQKRFDRIEQEALSRQTAEQRTATQTPFLVPRVTAVGVRYVRSLKGRRLFPAAPGNFCLAVLVALAAATVASILLLASQGITLTRGQLMLGLLYPLQLLLDFVGFAWLTWGFLKWRLGELELELSANCLRTGIRWGPWWLGSQRVRLERLKRLVVVKRTGGKSDPTWTLIAEDSEGSPTTLVSADDPLNVLPLATDLHARLARRDEFCRCWPALAEEDRETEVEPAHPPRRPLLPGGAWTWLAVHVSGTVGLWQIITLPWFKAPKPMWHTGVLVGLTVLQSLILLTNIGFLKVDREMVNRRPGA